MLSPPSPFVSRLACFTVSRWLVKVKQIVIKNSAVREMRGANRSAGKSQEKITEPPLHPMSIAKDSNSFNKIKRFSFVSFHFYIIRFANQKT